MTLGAGLVPTASQPYLGKWLGEHAGLTLKRACQQTFALLRVHTADTWWNNCYGVKKTNEEAPKKARRAGKDNCVCVCGGTLLVSCAPPNNRWYLTHCTQAKAHLHFLTHGQHMPDGHGHKKGTAKRAEPERATPQKVGIASLSQASPSMSVPGGCETQNTAVLEVPLSLCQPTPAPQQGATQSTNVHDVPLSLSEPTPALNLLGDHPPPPSGRHQVLGFCPCGLSRSEFVMVYPFATSPLQYTADCSVQSVDLKKVWEGGTTRATTLLEQHPHNG